MHTYNIVFFDDKTEEIQFSQQTSNGEWLSFLDGSGLILQVRAAEVARIERKPSK